MTEQQQQPPTDTRISTDTKLTKWYVIRVVSTKEKKAKEFIESELPTTPWKDVVKQVFLPTEKIFKIRKGKKIMFERNYYPGYLMLELEIDQGMPGDLVDFIKNIQFVLHFLGKDNPTPLSKLDVSKMLGRVAEELEDGEASMRDPYIVGESVKIIEGPFNDFNGTIEEVILEKKKLKVIVKIFGRSTPVDLSFLQVERIV